MDFEIWARFRKSKPSPRGLRSAKSHGCAGITAAVVGAKEKASLGSDSRMAQFTSLRYIGTKPPASGGRNSRSSTCSDIRNMARPRTSHLVVCVNNARYPASLERRKIYVALHDADAEIHGLIRIVDESGDDYLYPQTMFRPIALPQGVKKAVLAAV